MISIDNEALFKERLMTGINLFTGAGFSTLPFNGKSLPTAKELCQEICEVFKIQNNFGNNLEVISAIVPQQRYQLFLREKFTVSGYNELYNYINNINLNSIITTNIDNIPHLFISSCNKYFLNSITYYGASKKSAAEVDFLPLHGDVTNINYNLYFGKFELSIVDEINEELFSEMHIRLLKSPTLFWGYGFHDSGVLKTITKVLKEKSQEFWVQCLPNDGEMIDLFKTIGCNIIISNTEELLKWIKDNIPYEIEKCSTNIMSNDLKKYFIPTISDYNIESLPASEYYIKGITHWYPVLTKQAYETSMVNSVYNEALKNKNTIIIGGKFVGKSTMLMQLSLKVEAKNKLFIQDPISKEEANFILLKLNGEETWIFFENGALDIEALHVFAQSPNIKLITTSDDYTFETSKHLLFNIKYSRLEVGELQRREAELIFEHIPVAIRYEKFKFKNNDNEKYSMLELILKNVRGVFSRERITNILLSIKDKNEKAIKIIALVSYLVTNNSALSTDIMFSFFKLKKYDDVKNIIESINSILSDYNIGISNDRLDQDYYTLRSKLFAQYASESFSKNIVLKEIYANTIREFIYNVSVLKIYNYHIFKRKAYDGNLFAELFSQSGEEIYNFLYDRYKNTYTLQQKALFLGRIGKFEDAFSCINKARGKLPNNFSIKNSEAILLFEANKRKNSDLAISKMDESMSILEDCYTNDKRKVYHAQKYAEFALIFYHDFFNNKYISKANKWLSEIIDQKESLSQRTIRLKRDLEFICNK